MAFHIPFTFSALDKLKKRAEFLKSSIKYKKKSTLAEYLKNANIKVSREEYISITIKAFMINFLVLLTVFSIILLILKVKFFFFFGLFLSVVFSCFVLFSQLVYPKVYVMRRQRDIDKNLISALQDILIQLDSGVPLFSVMVNISNADYGELSVEFKKAVRKINSGSPEQDVLEELSTQNPSIYFKRTLWQISNGMNAGSDMAVVVRDTIKALNEEQIIQIQNYGGRLNPLVVFYMLIAVIIPALSITFLTIISSMVDLPGGMTTLLFIGLFVIVVFAQIMFLGLIRSRRPRLL